MESSIPVPTDNIFKFYALCGLLLFVFSWSAILYVNNSANEVVYATIPELEGLKQIAQPSSVEVVRISLLQRKLEVTKSNRTSYAYLLAPVAASSVLAMIYGFYKWHTGLQPVLDRTAKAEMEIAELQVKKLRRELSLEQKADEERARLESDQAPKV